MKIIKKVLSKIEISNDFFYSFPQHKRVSKKDKKQLEKMGCEIISIKEEGIMVHYE